MLTIQEMADDRARGLDAVDDIIRTAQEAERPLTDAERADIDYINAHVDAYTADITRARQDEGDQVIRANHDARRSWTAPQTVNFNTITTAPATATRSLDELLWATEDVVRAGESSDDGIFRANPYGAVAPVDQVVIRSDMNAAGTLAPRISEVLPDHRHAVRSFQKTVADMAIFGMMIDKDASDSRKGFEVARSHRAFADQWSHVLRALDVDTSGEGGTWVPTGIGANLHEKTRAMGKVAPLFTRIDIPTNPWKWPLEGADATAYRVAEPTGDTATKVTASTPGHRRRRRSTPRSSAVGSCSPESSRPTRRWRSSRSCSQARQAFVDAEEKAILDGDTDGTHQDTDTNSAGATDAAWAWDGLRKRALAERSASGDHGSTVANLLASGPMGKWGVNPPTWRSSSAMSSYYALLTDTNVLTVDKFGPNATILNGQLGSVRRAGHRVGARA
jgi:hypothetical protein